MIGNWIKFKNPNKVRDINYECLMNISTGAYVHIDILNNQADADQNLSVWVEFPGMKERRIYNGTQVECIRVIDNLAKQFSANELTVWDGA